jgi:hypothetical protein
MFGAKELKAKIAISDTEVECPVKDCSNRVPRQRKKFKPLQEFYCERDRIFISPSTFEYKHEKDNLLCQNSDEIDLLEAVKGKPARVGPRQQPGFTLEPWKSRPKRGLRSIFPASNWPS